MPLFECDFRCQSLNVTSDANLWMWPPTWCGYMLQLRAAQTSLYVNTTRR